LRFTFSLRNFIFFTHSQTSIEKSALITRINTSILGINTGINPGINPANSFLFWAIYVISTYLSSKAAAKEISKMNIKNKIFGNIKRMICSSNVKKDVVAISLEYVHA
jgi:hypothetical protein